MDYYVVDVFIVCDGDASDMTSTAMIASRETSNRADMDDEDNTFHAMIKIQSFPGNGGSRYVLASEQLSSAYTN